MTSVQKDLVLHFLRQGDWPQAIVFYREETGADVVTATEAVARVAERYGIRRNRSPWVRMAVLAVAVLAVTLWCMY